MRCSSILLTILLAGFVLLLGCQSGSSPSQLAAEKARAEAAEADAQSARRALAAETARADAAEAELAKLKATQTAPNAIDLERRAAEWVLRSGGSITVIADGRSQSIPAGEKLPDELQKLTAVSFDGKDVILNEGLEFLEGLPNLESVNLTANRGVTSIKSLRNCPRLRELYLRHTGITDAGLESIQALQQLETLSIGDTPLTDAGLKTLAGLPNLKLLDLFNCQQIPEAGLGHLAALPKLELLNVAGMPLTDAGMEHLKGLKNLKAVDVNGTKVTEAGAQSLRSVLPNCNVQNVGK